MTPLFLIKAIDVNNQVVFASADIFVTPENFSRASVHTELWLAEDALYRLSNRFSPVGAIDSQGTVDPVDAADHAIWSTMKIITPEQIDPALFVK
jgi:hypothetical protein